MNFSKEIFTFVDLEMNQPSRKIIQVGACVGNISTQEILEEYSAFVNPDEEISEYIVKLTGITQKDVDDKGVTLMEAYQGLAAMHKKHDAFCNPVQWGGGDAEFLREQLKLTGERAFWCFGRRWIDAKTLYQCWRMSQMQPIQGGLSKALKRLGKNFDGRKHNALYDSINTFYVFCILMKKWRK